MTGNDLIQQDLTTVTQPCTTLPSGWLHQPTLLQDYCASVASYFASYFVVVVQRKNKIHAIKEWTWKMIFEFKLKELGWSRNRTTILRDIEYKISNNQSCEFPKLFRCHKETLKSFKVYRRTRILCCFSTNTH